MLRLLVMHLHLGCLIQALMDIPLSLWTEEDSLLPAFVLHQPPSRPVSTLSRDGLRLQSLAAWDMFRDVNTTHFRAETGLIEAVNRYNREFMAESDALDYESSGTSPVPEALLVPSSGSYFIVVSVMLFSRTFPHKLLHSLFFRL